MQRRNVSKIYNLPEGIRYCARCVVSNQRPRIVFDADGVCNACRYAERKRSAIDWAERERQLLDLLAQHRRTDGRFDVVVPSSGGKDSAYVAHIMKYKYDMHPLTVTWSPNVYTDIGRHNYHKMIDSGLDNILGTPNGKVNRRMVRYCLEELGDPFQPFIYGQVLFPVKVALHYGVSLIMMGENAEVEYGGDPATENKRGHQVGEEMDVCFSKTDLPYWRKYFTESELFYYSLPDRDLVFKNDIQRHFMGYYRKWVPQENYYYCAQNIGFEPNPEGRSEGTYSKYASLDDKFDAFHPAFTG
jgi:N-acetyl sugar amidotransferase